MMAWIYWRYSFTVQSLDNKYSAYQSEADKHLSLVNQAVFHFSGLRAQAETQW